MLKSVVAPLPEIRCGLSDDFDRLFCDLRVLRAVYPTPCGKVNLHRILQNLCIIRIRGIRASTRFDARSSSLINRQLPHVLGAHHRDRIVQCGMFVKMISDMRHKKTMETRGHCGAKHDKKPLPKRCSCVHSAAGAPRKDCTVPPDVRGARAQEAVKVFRKMLDLNAAIC
jgi:hypothetical protein